MRLCEASHKRKNWLFSDTVHGARSSANLYSLIETAKANGLEPYAYLRRVFTELPRATTVADIEALLPWATMNDGWLQPPLTKHAAAFRCNYAVHLPYTYLPR